MKHSQVGRLCVLLATLLATACSSAKPPPMAEPPSRESSPDQQADLTGLMEGVDGTFVYFDEAADTGVVGGAEAVLSWDKEKHPKESWWDEVLAPMGLHWDLSKRTIEQARVVFETELTQAYTLFAKTGMVTPALAAARAGTWAGWRGTRRGITSPST